MLQISIALALQLGAAVATQPPLQSMRQPETPVTIDHSMAAPKGNCSFDQKTRTAGSSAISVKCGDKILEIGEARSYNFAYNKASGSYLVVKDPDTNPQVLILDLKKEGALAATDITALIRSKTPSRTQPLRVSLQAFESHGIIRTWGSGRP